MHYHSDKTEANMERSEHHTQIQSQTNAHPHHIHPPLCLRDLDANNRITEEDQTRGNVILPPPFAHSTQRPHHKLNSVQENQPAIGPYEDINNCEKRKLRWFGHLIRSMVRTSDQIKWPLQKDSYKAQYQGKEKEEGKIKDGKTTSESGPVSTSTAVREQPKTVRDGRRLSSMSTVVPLGP